MDHPTEEKKNKQALYSACKHFICIDFNGIPAFHKCHFRDLTAPRSEKNNVTGKHCNVLHVSALSRIHWEAAAEHHAVPVDE